MTDEISQDTFEHLVRLAALELEDQEAENIRRQLNLQLKSVHELQSIPVGEDIPPARHGVPFPPEISAPPRKDEWLPYPDADQILKQAPQTEERYFVVPEIPHTRLE
jgi:aspartyl/glutamyl-tRNA(Asn/Gln) amidotransferase C subunit